MLTSIALIFLMGLTLGGVFKKIHLPGLIGTLITGVLLGPYVFNLIDPSILDISADLRQIALIIILTRAGLSLNLQDLKKIGRSAVLMCFVPACFEILGMILLAPKLLGITAVEAALMGSVLAAVSPAVIVPRMITMMEHGYGKKKSIPQLIMAGASVDDIFVIVLFSSFLSLNSKEQISWNSLGRIPVSILLGIVIGVILGQVLTILFRRIHMRDSVKLLILLSISFLLVSLEKTLEHTIPFSGLLAVMSSGISLRHLHPALAARISFKLSKLWIGAEILLFVLVGATVDINYAVTAGPAVIVLVLLALLFRMGGVLLCLSGTDLNKKERIFCMIAYLPKATVQAAIGGLPLAAGLRCGQIILTAAVVSILITAPLGALGIDLTYKKLLNS